MVHEWNLPQQISFVQMVSQFAECGLEKTQFASLDEFQDHISEGIPLYALVDGDSVAPALNVEIVVRKLVALGDAYSVDRCTASVVESVGNHVDVPFVHPYKFVLAGRVAFDAYPDKTLVALAA